MRNIETSIKKFKKRGNFFMTSTSARSVRLMITLSPSSSDSQSVTSELAVRGDGLMNKYHSVVEFNQIMMLFAPF